MGQLANTKKISDIQRMLMDNATLLVAYPDSDREKSDEWYKKIDLCRIELRRRSKVAQGVKQN
jgi:hypothetical protein